MGTLSVSPEPAEVDGLVDQAHSTFLSGGGSHALRSDLPEELPKVLANPRRIVKVLNNLVSNAARHSPISSPIWISAERDGVHAAVSVSDEPKFRSWVAFTAVLSRADGWLGLVVGALNQAGRSPGGGFRILPPRYLRQARLRMRHQRSTALNCGAFWISRRKRAPAGCVVPDIAACRPHPPVRRTPRHFPAPPVTGAVLDIHRSG